MSISASYRLRPEADFPDHLIDHKRVIAWVREHGHEYSADSTEVYAAGTSAAGHMAAMAALTPNDPRFQPGCERVDTSVSAVICLTAYYGYLDDRNKLPSSPEAYLRPDTPSFFMAHGDNDTVFLIEGARHFAGKLAHVPHRRDLRAGPERPIVAVMVFQPSVEPTVFHAALRDQFEVFLDEHRSALHDSLNGLTEEQARQSLVPSKTTLLGLVKHATFVEKVWFDEAITCRPRTEIGIPDSPDESFDLHDDDTIASVQHAYQQACAASRRATAKLTLDDLLPGNRRGPLPLRWVYLHTLRELAQHCGHADILREQILSGTTHHG